jgi:asparagine synthase (glutamine-hydrolysing)
MPIKSFYAAHVREALTGYDPLVELREQLPVEFGKWHPLCQAQYLESAYLLPCYLLSSQGDRVGMANGVEGRFPFLDHRLVEFASRIPPNLKLRRLREKHILRVAAKELLPAEVLEREKQPYRTPDYSSLFANRQIEDYVEEALSARRLKEAGLFSTTAVQSLLAKGHRQKTLGTRDGMALVGLLSAQIIHLQFIAGDGPPKLD